MDHQSIQKDRHKLDCDLQLYNLRHVHKFQYRDPDT